MTILKKNGWFLKQLSYFAFSILNNNKDENLLKIYLAVKSMSFRGHLQNYSKLIWKSVSREKL